MTKTEKKIITTRHLGLVEFLRRIGVVSAGMPIHMHIESPAIIAGKEVIGVIPNHLGKYATSVTEVALKVPAEMRGKELSPEKVEKYFSGVEKFYILTKEDVEFLEEWLILDGLCCRGILGDLLESESYAEHKKKMCSEEGEK